MCAKACVLMQTNNPSATLQTVLPYNLSKLHSGNRRTNNYKRDAMREVLEQKQRMAEEFAAKLAAEKAAWEHETEQRILAAKEATRRQVVSSKTGRVLLLLYDKRWVWQTARCVQGQKPTARGSSLFA